MILPYFLSQLPALKRLRAPYLYINCIGNLRLEEIVLHYNYVKEHNYNHGTVGNFPVLKVLRIEFESDAHRNEGLPFIDIDTLPRLEEVITTSRIGFPITVPIKATQPVSHLRVVDIDGTHTNALSWLRHTTQNLRHLVLRWFDDASLPETPLIFDKVLTLELHWCNFSLFNEKMRFPNLIHFSETQAMYEIMSQPFDPLYIARQYINQLHILALRFEYDLRAKKTWHNISDTYESLESKLQLQRCLIQGSVTSPHSDDPRILYERRLDPGEERFELGWAEANIKRRQELLRWVDPLGYFKETQEPDRFTTQRIWL